LKSEKLLVEKPLIICGKVLFYHLAIERTFKYFVVDKEKSGAVIAKLNPFDVFVKSVIRHMTANGF